MSEEILKTSASIFSNSVDFLVKLLQMKVDESFIERSSISSKLIQSLLILTCDKQLNILAERDHSFRPHPRANISSPVDRIVIESLVKRLKDLRSLLCLDILDSDSRDHFDQRSDRNFSGLGVIFWGLFWHAVLTNNRDQIWAEAREQLLGEGTERLVVAPSHGDVSVFH